MPLHLSRSGKMTCPFELVLETVRLTPQQRAVLTHRYIPLIKHMRTRATRLTALFYVSHTIVTVGSLVVPALLSIQYGGSPEIGTQTITATSAHIYWATWVISLFVTICNGLLTLFKIDKRYYFVHTTMEQLTSEGWQYISLTSRYSGFYTPGGTPTHDNQFVFFCHNIEKIRMHQIEEEYYKLTDKQNAGTNTAPPGAAVGGATTSGPPPPASLQPWSPLRQDIRHIPSDLATEVEKQLSADEDSVQSIDGGGATAPKAPGGAGTSPNSEEFTTQQN